MSHFKKDMPHDSLPSLLPKGNLKITKILRKTITEFRAIASSNGAIINLANPQLFLDTIHLQEPKASSEP